MFYLRRGERVARDSMSGWQGEGEGGSPKSREPTAGPDPRTVTRATGRC